MLAAAVAMRRCSRLRDAPLRLRSCGSVVRTGAAAEAAAPAGTIAADIMTPGLLAGRGFFFKLFSNCA